jgi:dolichol kinase
MDGRVNELQLNEQLGMLADDLWRFLSQVQRPRIADQAWVRQVEAKTAELCARLEMVRQAVAARRNALEPALDRLMENLRTFRAELAQADTAASVRRTAKRLSESYEEFVTRLRASRPKAVPWRVRLRKVKPANYARAVFHISWGLFGVAMYQFFLTWGQALGILLGFCGLVAAVEISRRVSQPWNELLCRTVFKHVIRPREHHRIVAASWYTLALTIMVLLLPKAAAMAGALVLAFGDPMAGIFGRKWGTWKIRHEKSWVGTGAFVVAGSLAVFGLSWLALPEMGLAARFGWAITSAAGGATAEVFSDRIDDNLTVGIAAGCVAALWLL